MLTNTQENKMGTAPVPSLLLKMALPIILSTLVQSLYNIVDAIFVSRISEEAMTAITFANPVILLLIAAGTGIAVGMNTMLSHGLGEQNKKDVDYAAQTAMFLAVIAGIVSLIMAFTAVRPFMASQTSNPVIAELGTEYLTIYLALGIGTVGQLVFERMLISTGRTHYSMLSQFTGAVLNLVLDPLLIFGLLGMPEMGIAGAALATVLSQLTAMLIALILNIKKNPDITLRFSLKPPAYALKRVLYLGIPSSVMVALNAFLMFGLNAIIKDFSTTAVAAFGACCRITTLFYNLVISMSNTLTPVIAYNYGARKKQRINQSMKYGYIYSVFLTFMGTVVCMAVPDRILYLFNATDEMAAVGVYALRIMCSGYMLLALRNVSCAIIQALGHSVHSMIVDLCRNYLFLLPFAWLLSRSGILNRVFWAYPIADIAAAAVGLLLVRHFYGKDIKPLEQIETENIH